MPDEAQDEQEISSAVSSALRILGQRDHSKAELKEKLLRRNVADLVAECALSRVDQMGYLDDSSYAATLVRSKPDLSYRGLKRLLRQKGVADSVVEAALEHIDEDEELRRAQNLAEKYSFTWNDKGHLDQKSLRRFLAYMGRRGYSQSTAFKAIEQGASQREFTPGSGLRQ